MAYRLPLATVSSPGTVQVGSNLSITPAGLLSATAGAGGAIGYFYSTAIQTNPVQSAINTVSFSNTVLSQGVSLVAGTQLTVAAAGNYSLQFTVQADKTDAGTDFMDIWLRRNGIDETDSNTSLSLVFNNAVLLAGWQYSLALAAGDYLEIMWQSLDANVRLLATGPQINPVRPATPSARATLTQV